MVIPRISPVKFVERLPVECTGAEAQQFSITRIPREFFNIKFSVDESTNKPNPPEVSLKDPAVGEWLLKQASAKYHRDLTGFQVFARMTRFNQPVVNLAPLRGEALDPLPETF